MQPETDPGRKVRVGLVIVLVALIIGALGAAAIYNFVSSAVSSLPTPVSVTTVQVAVQPTETVTLAPTPSRRGVEQAKTVATPQSQPPASQATATSLPQTTVDPTSETTVSAPPSKTAPTTATTVTSTEPTAPATTAAAEATP